jgi:hypothetical protein
MSILNKFLITAIALLVIQGILVEFTPRYSCISFSRDHSWYFSTALVLIMMLLNGTFMNTRYFYVAKVGLGILVLGILFKVMHLTGADQILAFSVLVLFLSYGIHFVLKRPKTLLDFFKVLTMLSFVVPIPLILFHITPGYYIDPGVEILRFGMLWATFLLFLMVERKKLWAKRISTP